MANMRRTTLIGIYRMAQNFVQTVPDAPTISSTLVGSGSVTVSYSPPAFDGNANIFSYTITSSPGGFTGTGTGNPVSISGLTNGVAYTFTVHATNAIGSSIESTPSSGVTPVFSRQTVMMGYLFPMFINTSATRQTPVGGIYLNESGS